MIQQSRVLRVCAGVPAVIAGLFLGGYAISILIEAFDRNGSPGGGALLLAADLILLLFAGAVLRVGMNWSRARGGQKQ